MRQARLRVSEAASVEWIVGGKAARAHGRGWRMADQQQPKVHFSRSIQYARASVRASWRRSLPRRIAGLRSAEAGESPARSRHCNRHRKPKARPELRTIPLQSTTGRVTPGDVLHD